MDSRKLLVFFTLSTLFCNLCSSHTVNLEFPFFTHRNLTLLGDAYLRNGVVGLSRELRSPSSSSGSFICNDPVHLFDPATNATASFSTRFAFSILNLNPTSYGDGLTFFLSPNSRTSGSPGGYLGLVNSSRLTKNRFVAIEFDTKQDLHFDDPDDNHLGLDIDSLISIETVNPMVSGIDLKSGNVITAWVDYLSDKKKVEVFLSYSSFKPESAMLSVNVDLSDYLKEVMFVGFSAATEGSTELHFVENWSFQTRGFNPVKPRPRLHPHNVSENRVPLSYPLPVLNSGNGHHKMIRLGLGIGFPSFFCAVLVLSVWFSIKKSRSEKGLKPEFMAGPRQFTYKELKSATRGFHQSRILGYGAFGTVYKAFFTQNDAVSAVKRSKHSHEGKTELLSELSIIACLRHKNLVQLQGWCAEKGELLLVYEFMPNGSLDTVLYQDTRSDVVLKWGQRYNIAVGLASVLSYLHQECEQQVIHRDIKTSNIMLDSGYNARLGDFGLARLMDHNKSPVSTLTAGTMGYLAPEYLQCGKATEKTDVYSYGVVILELACGRRPIEREECGQKMVNLVDWVWGLYSEGRVEEAVDGRMKGAVEAAEVRRLMMVGLSCANPDSGGRPTMRRVLQILKGEAENVAVPRKKPSLTFSNSLPLSIDEIVSESDCGTPLSQLEIRVD